MATNWTYGGVPIIVTEIEGESKSIIARLFPYQSDTVHQTFGYEGKTRQVTAKVVGGSRIVQLESFTTSGVAFEFANPGDVGSLGNYLLQSISYQRDKFIKQYLDSTQDVYTPVYTAKLTLLYEP